MKSSWEPRRPCGSLGSQAFRRGHRILTCRSAGEDAEAGPSGINITVSLLSFGRDVLKAPGSKLTPLVLLMVAGALVDGLGLLLLVPLAAVLLGGEQAVSSQMLMPVLDFISGVPRLWQLAGFLATFLLLMAIRGAIIVGRDLALARMETSFVDGKRQEIVRLLTAAPWALVARLRHSRLVHILGQDVQAVGSATHLFLQAGVLLTLLIVQAFLIAALSFELALFVSLIFLTFATALRPLLRSARKVGTELTHAQLRLVDATVQHLGGLKLAISHSLQSSYLHRFEQEAQDAAECRLSFARQRSLTSAGITLGMGAAAAIVLLVGAGIMSASAPILLAFLLILARMSGLATRLQHNLQYVAHALPAYGKLLAIEAELRSSDCAQSDPAPVTRPALRGALSLSGVHFVHSRAEDPGGGGVRGLDVEISAGETVGVAGPSGAGKTTFADLVVGLYTPQSGAVRVDGEALVGDRLAHWRSSISYVVQDSFLLHGTIRENLLWAAPSAGEAELSHVLELVGADVLVERLERGVDTPVGERGILLSGGERQRLALARGLLRRPSLLLLDEACNAIDPEQEAVIMHAIRAAYPEMTIIMIAHREETLRLCPRVLRFENGRSHSDVRALPRTLGIGASSPASALCQLRARG